MLFSGRQSIRKSITKIAAAEGRQSSILSGGQSSASSPGLGGRFRALTKRITEVKKSTEDLKYLQHFRVLCESLVEIKNAPKDHPIVPWSRSVRSAVTNALESTRSNDEKVDIVLNAIYKADEEHNEISRSYEHTKTYMKSVLLANADETVIRPMAELELRKLLFKNYLIHLRTMKISSAMPPISDAKVMRIVDAFLRGTSSERLAEHLSLYNSPMTNAELQDAFYVLFEPEVKLIGEFLQQTTQFTSNKHKKALKKWLDTYLLDDLELNVKSRCVFVWVGDKYKEIRSLKDTDVEPTGDILLSRRKYFEEGHEIAKAMCDSYLSKVRLQDFERQEWRTNVIRGWGFFLGICVLDGIITGL